VRRIVLAVTAAAALALAAVAAPAAQAAHAPEQSSSTLDKESLATRVKHQATGRAGTSSIVYHGGSVLTSTSGSNAYLVWYGSWAPASQQIVRDFASNVGGSPYFGINTTYTDAAGKKVTNKVTVAGETTDTVNRGTSLSDAAIQSIVSDAITSGRLPKDTNGVYFVLTAAGVTASSGFLTQYCGWHTNASIAGSDIKFAFVGDPTGPSIANCAVQTTASPNGVPGVDAMISVVAHELEETVTDPDLNAWYDRAGNENADKCAWTFGTTYSAGNGSVANVKLGARNFLIQRNWRAGRTQGCAMS
jgi:hypothetical protein